MKPIHGKEVKTKKPNPIIQPINWFLAPHPPYLSLRLRNLLFRLDSPMATIHNLRPAIPVSPSLHFPSSPRSPPFSFKTHFKAHFFSTVPSSIYYHQAPSLTGRLFLPSVSGIWDALTGGNNNSREAVLAIRRGMLLFREGDVSGSLVEFDKAIELDPRQKAYLWQRGLSLYYLDRFEEGAEQFRLDVAQNPNDTEESMWCFLCEAQLYGVDEARSRFLEVGRDPRPVMRGAYNLFKDGGDPEKLVAEFTSGRENDYFYASLYAGLYYESEKKVDASKLHILAASQSQYGQRSDDYMAALAKVHCLSRNWISK
ncbi:Tetratricopeptide repeat (TPR)-like superfamily protein [Quillaja saponaria]|uniref:Tetratricopeptide repeat (TPR)-like superfamily protein n=1 Tax=Quillaja saponaria TaxID=32244 RepID=A0AAD7VEW5_QUISA|nr:Tetratricopeptide repeat (TPR)-like superfamily protein [Quillaja saponaria]